jgi:hypothetical protein
MSIYHWIALISFAIFLSNAVRIFYITLLKKGNSDPSVAKGRQSAGIIYSFTGAMSPVKKESAFLHLPTYTAGLIFHLGTFLSLLWLIILFFNIESRNIFIIASAVFIMIACICGIGILIKRIINIRLRQMSNADDYLSNLLVTAFQLITALTIYFKWPVSLLFIYSAILLIYIPIGKLRHSVYFFIARYQLGKYFGKRGVWPVK